MSTQYKIIRPELINICFGDLKVGEMFGMEDSDFIGIKVNEAKQSTDNVVILYPANHNRELIGSTIYFTTSRVVIPVSHAHFTLKV